ncbi:MAG: PilX N-terminal domain-containing pilus assembly protein [Bacteroidota bacterium]
MKKNNGFVLVTGMVFLLVITILVVYLMRTSILEEKMAANSIDRQRALQAADAVLREAEAVIAAGGPPFDPFNIDGFSATCASGLCKHLGKASPWTAISWSTTANLKLSSMAFTTSKVVTPYYVIEMQTPSYNKPAVGCTEAIYRIIARGVGKIGAESVVQSNFKIAPDKCP